MKLREPQIKFAGLCDQQQTIVEKAVSDARPMTDDETAAFNDLQKQIEGLASTITMALAMEGRSKELDQPDGKMFRPGGDPEGEPKGQGKLFSSLGEQLCAVVRAERRDGSIDQRLIQINNASGMSEAIPSEGSWLVEQDYTQDLLKRAYETGILAPKCFKQPIGPLSNGFKKLVVDETSRVTGSRRGGIQVYWEGEGQAPLGSKPKFRLWEQTLKKMVGVLYATEELLQDSVALEAWVRNEFAQEFGFMLDDAIVNGTGAGMPLGFLICPALITVAKEAGQAADTVVYENILKMWNRMLASRRVGAEWYINQDIEPQLWGMSMTVGTGGVPVYLPAGGLSQSPYASLFGRPVIPIEQCDTLGNKGDIVLANLKDYTLIDKNNIQAASSIHVKFLEAETAFRFIYRVNGAPEYNSPITPYKGTNTVSPFITLAERV